uniref:Homeobox domain-containing protein n=1 Tax=Salarias fasciatus TaxID=181472 RepID=A0A672GPS3_SALFA
MRLSYSPHPRIRSRYIAPVSPNTPSSAKAASLSTPPAAKSSPTESSFLPHSSSRRPRTHLSCLQLSILQSCYETCAHPNAMECEAIGTELNLPLKVVQIWFQNTRAKEKRWRLKMHLLSLFLVPSFSVLVSCVGREGGHELRKLPAVQRSQSQPAHPAQAGPAHGHRTRRVPVAGQPVPKETLTGRCDACNVSFESRAAARAHVFSPVSPGHPENH